VTGKKPSRRIVSAGCRYSVSSSVSLDITNTVGIRVIILGLPEHAAAAATATTAAAAAAAARDVMHSDKPPLFASLSPRLCAGLCLSLFASVAAEQLPVIQIGVFV